MRAIWAFVLVFASILQTLKCQEYYPQWNTRQETPIMNQGVPVGMQGQPVQQAPNQQQFPQQGQQQGPQQFPQQGQQQGPQQFPQQGQQQGPQQFPQQGPQQGLQQFPQQGQQQFPQQGQQSIPSTGQLPNQQPNTQIPISPPYGMNLTPEGQWAYSYIMQQIAQILNDPTSRNGFMYLVNSLGTILRNPNSFVIMQDFVNRWMNAANQPIYGGTSGLGLIQNTQPSTFVDMLKRKGAALVNFTKDMAQAKENAFNTIFGGTARASTDGVTARLGGLENMMPPFLNTQNTGTAPGG